METACGRMIDFIHIDVVYNDNRRIYETYDNTRFGRIQERVERIQSDSKNLSSVRMVVGIITNEGLDVDDNVWNGEYIEEFFEPLYEIVKLSPPDSGRASD
jgi:hypothetical protein